MGIVVRIVDNTPQFLQRTRDQVAAGVEAAARVLAESMRQTLSRKSARGGGGGYGSGRGGNVPSSPGDPPTYQRGELTQSIRSTKASARGTQIVAYAGTNKKYGASLDMGYSATAKKMFTIPLQQDAYIMLEMYGSTKNIPGLFKVRTHGGRTLLCLKGPGGSIRPMYKLQKRIVVEPRPWLRPSLDRARIAMAAAFNRAASVAGRSAA